MANDFGQFMYKRPQDIVAEMNKMFTQASQSGNVNAMRAANYSRAAFNTFGSPELQEAKKKEEMLKHVTQEVAEFEGSDIEKQQNYFRVAQQRAMEYGFTDIAMQASQKLTNLQLTNEERQRLTSQEGRLDAQVGQSERRLINEGRAQDRADAESAIAAAKEYENTTLVLYNPQDPRDERGYFDVSQNAPEGWEEANFARQEFPGYQLVSLKKYNELIGNNWLNDMQAARAEASLKGDNVGENRINNHIKFITPKQAFAQQASRLVSFLSDPRIQDQGGWGSGGAVAGFITNLGNQAKSLLQVSQSIGWDAEAEKYNTNLFREKYGSGWDNLADEKKSLIMNLGYALATSREGGRLTDQDVTRAITSLGLDAVNPKSVALILMDNLVDQIQAVDDYYTAGNFRNDDGSFKYAFAEQSHASTVGRYQTAILELASAYGLQDEIGESWQGENSIVSRVRQMAAAEFEEAEAEGRVRRKEEEEKAEAGIQYDQPSRGSRSDRTRTILKRSNPKG